MKIKCKLTLKQDYTYYFVLGRTQTSLDIWHLVNCNTCVKITPLQYNSLVIITIVVVCIKAFHSTRTNTDVPKVICE